MNRLYLSGPKLTPLLSNPPSETESNIVPVTTNSLEADTKSSLAAAFGDEQEEVIEPEPIELGWSAYLSRNYSTALLHARDAINLNSEDAEAWRLSSQAHFQLGKNTGSRNDYFGSYSSQSKRSNNENGLSEYCPRNPIS